MAAIIQRSAERDRTTLLLQKSAAGVKMEKVAAVKGALFVDKNDGVRWGGRTMGATNIRRGQCSWNADYLCDGAVYPERLFRRQFGVPWSLFWRIHDDLVRESTGIWGTRRVVGNSTGIRFTV